MLENNSFLVFETPMKHSLSFLKYYVKESAWAIERLGSKTSERKGFYA